MIYILVYVCIIDIVLFNMYCNFYILLFHSKTDKFLMIVSIDL